MWCEHREAKPSIHSQLLPSPTELEADTDHYAPVAKVVSSFRIRSYSTDEYSVGIAKPLALILLHLDQATLTFRLDINQPLVTLQRTKRLL